MATTTTTRKNRKSAPKVSTKSATSSTMESWLNREGFSWMGTPTTVPHPRDPSQNLSAVFIPLTASNALAWLKRNTNNRTPKVQHILNLAQAMRAGEFYGDATVTTISWAGIATDGQNRMGAVVLAHGSAAEREQLVRLFGMDSTPRAWSEFPVSESEPDNPELMLMEVGCHPDCFRVQDQDHAQRTGADMLAHDTSTGNWLSEMAIDPKVLQQTLRALYLRTTPGKVYVPKEGENNGPRYGSLAKGGRISARTYVERYLPLWGDKVKSAAVKLRKAEDAFIDTAAEEGRSARDVSYDNWPWPEYMILAAVTLAYADSKATGDAAVSRAVKLLDIETDGIPSVVRQWRKSQADKPKAGPLFSSLVYYLHGEGDKLRTVAQLKTVLFGDKDDKNPEQESAFRFNGPDSKTA